MKKRIYINFLGVIILLSLLLSFSTSIIYYNSNKNSEFAAVRDQVLMFADFYNRGLERVSDNPVAIRFSDYLDRGAADTRLTIIAPDGEVMLDSKSVAADMENHSDREEFIQALQTGAGEAVRFSSTITADTYYYAMRLDDGNILRMSKTISSITGVFWSIMYAIAAITALMLLLTNFIAHKLTDNILRPVNDLDFNDISFFESKNDSIYEELLPFIKRINTQKLEIDKQITELKERADIMEAITGSMREGLILVDKAGIVLAANWSAIYIFDQPDMLKMDILHVYRNTAFRNGVKDCLAGGGAQINMERGGRIYNINFSPVYSGLEINGAIILLFDVTDRHRAEQQRREFTANVSHELKTPLTAISALSELIESGMAKDGDIKGFAAKISVQVKRLINIIDDIIKLSEFDEGAADKNTEDAYINLFEIAESVKSTLLDKANAKRVAVSISGGRFNIYANRRMVEELLFNLVDNGIKYNIDDGTVNVKLNKKGGMCKISVSDTGIGIAEEHHDRVFERFYRVDKSRSKMTEGTGLGLSIAKHIVIRLGGRIELTSVENAGTTVSCYLDVLR